MCLDINECQTDNGGCGQTCDNTDGSYKCSCLVGYELTGDGQNCIGEYTPTYILYSGLKQSWFSIFIVHYNII